MKRKSNRKKNIKKNKKGGFIEGLATTYIVPIAGRILSIAFFGFLSMYFKGKISQTNAILKQPEYVQAAANLKAAKKQQKLEGTSKSSMLKDKLSNLSIPKPNMPQLGQTQGYPVVQGGSTSRSLCYFQKFKDKLLSNHKNNQHRVRKML